MTKLQQDTVLKENKSINLASRSSIAIIRDRLGTSNKKSKAWKDSCLNKAASTFVQHLPPLVLLPAYNLLRSKQL